MRWPIESIQKNIKMNIWKKTNLNTIKKKKISYKIFNNSIWKKKILKKINLNKIQLKKKYTNFFLSSSPLPLMVLNYKKGKIKIADYGSGAQEILFQLVNNNFKKKEILIDSIEVYEITNLLKKKIKKKITNNIKVNFISEYDFKKKYDFVHISDSLQYNLEWKKFLKKILLKQPNYIILNNLTAGNFKTYITQQNFYGHQLPYIFFNEREILKIFKKYKVLKYLYLNKINNKYQEYPQNNFKIKDRLLYPKTLILAKN